MISSLPKVGKVDFCCFLVFPHEGKAIFDDFLFSPVRERRFSLFFVHRTPTKASFFRFPFIVPLRKPPFPVFRSSYLYESLLFPFFVHRTPTKASFCRFSFIVPLRKPLFSVFRSSYLVSGQFFPKSDDLLPYLD